MAVGPVSILGRIGGRILQGLIPMSVARQQAFFTDNWLADVEADHDVWEPSPPLAPWEQELRDAFYMNDEQWAARQRSINKSSAGTSSPSVDEHPPAGGTAPNLGLPPVLSLVQPAAADSGRPFGGGRHSKTDHRTDEQVIEELVEDFRAFITDCFDKRFRN